MTIEEMKKRFEKYQIPDSATVMSDSGWECDATDMDGLYYNEATNTLVFTQGFSKYEDTYTLPGWKPLYGAEEKEEAVL